MPTPIVSIALITYQHESCVSDAIAGALMQEGVDIEIVAADDASDDRTRAILERAAIDHPLMFRLLPPAEHMGMHSNYARTIAACRGRYIALLEGDDYWIDSRKLEFQCAILEEDATASFCFHPVYRSMNGLPAGERFGPRCAEDRIYLRDLLENNIVPTCSAVFRRSLFDGFPWWVSELPMVDWPLWVILGRRGHARYLDRVMGVYRVHGGGVWTTLQPADELEKRAHALKTFGYIITDKDREITRRRRAELLYRAARLRFDASDIASTTALLEEARDGEDLLTPEYRRKLRGLTCEVFIRTHLPRIERLLRTFRRRRRLPHTPPAQGAS